MSDHRSQLFNLDEDPGENHDRIDDPACAGLVAELTARVQAGWDPARIQRLVSTRGGEFQLLRRCLQDVRPPEPDAPWYGNHPPVNEVDTRPG